MTLASLLNAAPRFDVHEKPIAASDLLKVL